MYQQMYALRHSKLISENSSSENNSYIQIIYKVCLSKNYVPKIKFSLVII